MKLIDKIELTLFKDDANGDYGVAHKQCVDNYESFNAFWDGIGIFHDVWEHQHEYKHKYFSGNYAMNVGGEMAAMGKMWYYQTKLGLWNKRRLNPNSFYSDGDTMRESTASMIQEAVCYGYTNFGSTLESCVPKQSPVEDGEMEYQIEKFWKNCKTWTSKETDENEKEYAKQYKDSVTFRKIADLHRWGYKEGERIVPNNWENRNTLYEFISFWNDFTKNNNAEELSNYFKSLIFYIYKENDIVFWKCKAIGKAGINNIKIINSKQCLTEEIYDTRK